MSKFIKPENILPDDESSKIIDGVRVRKGTVGAVLANAKILTSASSTASLVCVHLKQNPELMQ